MTHPQKSVIQGKNDIKGFIEIFSRNYKLFIICIIIFLGIAFLANRFLTPLYKVTSSMLISEESRQNRGNMNDFINNNLFGTNRNFQNELWVLKSSPVIEQMIKNLDLNVNYFRKDGIRSIDSYKEVPFRILLLTDHIQPMNVKFYITFLDNENFIIKAQDKNVNFKNPDNLWINNHKKKWDVVIKGKFGELIETEEMAFIVKYNEEKSGYSMNENDYGFYFVDVPSLIGSYKSRIEFRIIDREATVIEIALKTPSVNKGKDILNEMMYVYSQQNLGRKNHIANITIDYIDNQLEEISESLSQTEDNLQSFRSSNQLLNVTEQATGISSQYMDLQNQQAELITRKRYYDYVADYLSNNENYANMIVPASMGIEDQLLNNLMAELTAAQTQQSNLINNRQEKNPLVQKLEIQIDNTKKTISENITAVRKTIDISIDEMNKRIRKVEAQINQLPKTQRQLGGIERKYRLNDAIYNYLLEKRAEAKISQASNLPDNIIIEPANITGTGPVFPNSIMNYLGAVLLGFIIPFGFILFRKAIDNKIQSQEDLESLSDVPVIGKILHNRRKESNVVFDFPRSNISESFRSLRTNLEYQFREIKQKVIMVTSCIEGEGKSFTALNLAMSYAQLGHRTILLDFDLRKITNYFSNLDDSLPGISSYLNGKAKLEDIILHTSNEKMDYLPSGPIPPDPIELLSQNNIKEFLEYFKNEYDCIIIDSSPLAQVSDAYLLIDHTDVKVIVTRYNYSLKKVYSLIMNDLMKKNINNTCVIMNDNRVNQDQYGYGYGYNKKKSILNL